MIILLTSALPEKNGPTTERSEVGDSDGGPDTIFRFSEISVDQVLNNLKQLIVSKSTGIDKIPAKVLKVSGDIIAPSLTKILTFRYILAYLLVTGN